MANLPPLYNRRMVETAFKKDRLRHGQKERQDGGGKEIEKERGETEEGRNERGITGEGRKTESEKAIERGGKKEVGE